MRKFARTFHNVWAPIGDFIIYSYEVDDEVTTSRTTMVQHTKSYSQAQLAQDHSVDDTFQLFDLRVEVVIPAASSPPGDPVKLMCGAKVGDHFELKGEMLYLPPGQGMSIYSIGMLSVTVSWSSSELLPTQQAFYRYLPRSKDKRTQMTGWKVMPRSHAPIQTVLVGLGSPEWG